MSFYMTLDLQGFDRVLAVREWFRGSNFGGSNVDATIRWVLWSLGDPGGLMEFG